MEPEYDLTGCRLKLAALGPCVPQPAQSPLIERGQDGRAVAPSRILGQSLARSKALGTSVAGIRFRGLQIAVRRRFDSFTSDANQVARHGGGSVFTQEFLDHPLGLLVLAFAEVVITDSALPIDEVVGRPVVVAKRVPDGVVA